MGEVWMAQDVRLARSVAIKIASQDFSNRFEREARAIAALNHPNICTLYDVGPNFLVMELVQGETLAARLKKGKLSLRDTLKYGAQIADALAAAHAKSIVHRDLKPGNIMLTGSSVKVLDFGLAKSADSETVTAANAVMGTPAYMAPEQRTGGQTDSRTDIYALGLVIYEMAAGVRAVAGEALRMDRLPPQLAHVIDRCVAEDADDRWQTIRDVRSELEWVAEEPAPWRRGISEMLRRGGSGPWAVLVWQRPLAGGPCIRMRAVLATCPKFTWSVRRCWRRKGPNLLSPKAYSHYPLFRLTETPSCLESELATGSISWRCGVSIPPTPNCCQAPKTVFSRFGRRIAAGSVSGRKRLC